MLFTDEIEDPYTHMRIEHISVIGNCIRIKGEVLHE